MVNGDELGAVGERGLDLDFVDHFRDAFHDLVALAGKREVYGLNNGVNGPLP